MQRISQVIYTLQPGIQLGTNNNIHEARFPNNRGYYGRHGFFGLGCFSCTLAFLCSEPVPSRPTSCCLRLRPLVSPTEGAAAAVPLLPPRLPPPLLPWAT